MLTLLPELSGSAWLAGAVIGAIAGLSVWLAGARFSRHLVSLLLTAIGAMVGLQLPKWLGWNMNGGGTAVALAVIGGVLGFLLHRFWVGLLLGTVLAFWTALICWTLLNNDQPLTWPTLTPETSAPSYASELWQSLPPDVTRVVPYAAGTAMVSGICLALLWPRLATVLSWSLIGLTLLLVCGIEAIVLARPAWMAIFPAQPWAQTTAFVGLAALGAVLQWQVAPRQKSRVSAAEPAPSIA